MLNTPGKLIALGWFCSFGCSDRNPSIPEDTGFDVSQVEQGYETGPPPTSPISLSFAVLPEGTNEAILDTEELEVEVHNSGDTPLIIDFIAIVDNTGDGQLEIALDDQQQSIEPNTSQTVVISLQSLQVEMSNEDYATGITLRAASSSQGNLVAISYSPTLYLHLLSSDNLTTTTYAVYNETTLVDTYGSGLLSDAESSDDESVEFIRKISLGQGQNPPLFDYGPDLDLPIQIPNHWSFCFRLTTMFTDQGFGADYYSAGNTMVAHGLKVKVSHKARNGITNTYFDSYADPETGCISFQSAEVANFNITAYAEAKLGKKKSVTVQAFPNPTKEAVRAWSLKVSPGGVPRQVQIVIPSGAEANLLAGAIFPIYRLDKLTGGVIEWHKTLQARLAPEEDNSETNHDDVLIAAVQFSRRAVIAHEVGHWLFYEWSDLPSGSNLGIDSTTFKFVPEACDSLTAVYPSHAHLLRSLELQSAGLREGFAHFVATFTYNNTEQENASFVYYKDVSKLPAYLDVITGNYVVDMRAAGNNPLGGARRWSLSQCNIPEDKLEKFSSELDWARFYWRYLTANTQPFTKKPSLKQVLDHLTALNAHLKDNKLTEGWDTYTLLRNRLDNGNLGQQDMRQRWDLLAIEQGIRPE